MKCFILLFFGCIMAGVSVAQNPGFHGLEPKPTPETDFYKQQITGQVLKQLDKIDWSQVQRTTNGDSVLYTIPVVVHVLHNYGAELIPDSNIYNLMSSLNSYFLKTRSDTVNIIDKFKSVAASTQIAFKLATIAPNGNQTKGIEHIFTYLTYSSFLDQLKINQWLQERYLNIWIVNSFGTPSGYTIAEYYYTPYDAAYRPYYDGMVFLYDISPIYFYSGYYIQNFARYLNLPYPCDGYAPTACVDNDGIADTPPCQGGTDYTCLNLYDTTCDTANGQNIMINADTCGIMFTYGQAQYMQYILQIDIGNRDSLVTPNNFTTTGMNQPMPDMLPVPDFSIGSVNSMTVPPKWFYCEGQGIQFYNRSWNDTITAASWTFSNDANTPASTSLTDVNNVFHKPGWVTVSLAVTGNNTGTATLTNSNALYIADSAPTNAVGYLQEFLVRGGLDGWPIFNYYNNAFKWQMAYVGCFDNTSLEYTGFDTRTFPQNMTGTPQGDVDDIFTPAFDFTGFGSQCNLNFMSSGATYSSKPRYMNDSLEIDYSVNQTITWSKLTVLKGSGLDNKGTITTPYTPASVSDWIPHTIPLPPLALSPYTIFRFRYYPCADSTGMSTGNNFYLDHFNFSVYAEDITVINSLGDGVSVMPNPTQGSSYVIIKDKTVIFTATIEVTDVTGKVVYHTVSNNNSNTARVELPGNIFTSKGLYLVHVITGGWNQTAKLVVY